MQSKCHSKFEVTGQKCAATSEYQHVFMVFRLGGNPFLCRTALVLSLLLLCQTCILDGLRGLSVLLSLEFLIEHPSFVALRPPAQATSASYLDGRKVMSSLGATYMYAATDVMG